MRKPNLERSDGLRVSLGLVCWLACRFLIEQFVFQPWPGALCSWARHSTHTVPISTGKFNATDPGESRNTPSWFMLLKPGDCLFVHLLSLGIRKVQTQGENLRALQAKFDDRGKVFGSCYCKFLLRSLIKINKRQLISSTYRWYYRAAPEILCFGNQSEQFR